jgi:hypothetical protein
MNIFQAKIIPLVICPLALTGCEALGSAIEFLEFLVIIVLIIVELCRSIRDYPWFWITFLIVTSVIIGFWYIFYGRKYYREVEIKLARFKRKLDRLNGEKCPYCGKRKKGMADHIAAMHPEHSKGKAK